MKSSRVIPVALVLGLAWGCASVQQRSYGDGWVKSSPVAYSFVGQPLLQSMQGRSYHGSVAGKSDAAMEIAALQQHGMTRCADARQAAVLVLVELGSYREGAPGAMNLGGKWYPAFEVTVPYTVTFKKADGSALAQQGGQYTNMLTFRQMPGFASREQAVGAIDTVRKLAAKRVQEQTMVHAQEDARKTANQAAEGLFRQRDIKLEVPVVRSAAGVDLEGPYQLLAEAKDPEQVRAGLAAYEQCGTEHKKADGTPDVTANYGVHCGVAAARLMLRDLRGAWEASKLAAALVPAGEEAQAIRRVVAEQERATGERVIPDAERGSLGAGPLQGLMQRRSAAPGRD
jgi:hypothetical protein